MKKLLILCLLLPVWVCTPYSGYTQSSAEGSPSPPPPRHQFDFWIGNWVVQNVRGDTLGYNRIRSIAEGNALLEHWTSRNGISGNSLNYYDPADGYWHQHWVGGNGMILHLSGKLNDGKMVLEGTRSTDNGTLLDRISWKALGANRVEQRWESKEKGTGTWKTVFLGVYRRRGAGE